MKTEIKTDFENFTFQAKRVFDAPVSLVWKAYTEKALLDQWWAPKPWKTETKSLDFREGGNGYTIWWGLMGNDMALFKFLKKLLWKNTSPELMLF